ncbi:phosphatase PAP2 family protein [Vibrio mangrovi]|uniref:Lipid A 1-phosphatase n=1 Tax=Vibrio mangrovi TaxID=474394 RepID=A0A1Y6INJ9_9VIBR|nr:phosphatase PAP2 family protein [Vibrio mangrovi]MDW6003978.1 phosphatase PAP2 family protein [Vibrio mangrovi]SMR99226.1 lipid A 1-phosphatase [Vibrio mangrovi]
MNNMVRFFLFSLTFLFFLTTPNLVRAGGQLTHTGDIAEITVPLTAGVISLWKDDTEGFYQLVEGALYTAAATHTLKALTHERRPNGSGFDSFPSGHVSAVTQGAAYLHFRYGLEYGLPAYGVAAFVAHSRVESHKHSWYDVGAGAVLAIGIQYAVTEMGYSLTQVSVLPYTHDDEVGIIAHVRF